MSGETTLVLSQAAYGGWQDVRVTAGIERGTRDFQITLTDKYPSQASELVVKPGDTCQIKIGGDLQLTGYVNRYTASFTKDSHKITIAGRGKCQDLIDSSAEWPSCQIGGNTALGIAQKLAQPYGITVGGETGLQIPQFNIMVTETPWSIIDRITRYSQLLAYELADGSLTFSSVGTVSAASGFAQGQNAQAAEFAWSDDQRYSEYDAYLLAFDPHGDVLPKSSVEAKVTDPNVLRHRMLKLVAESGGGKEPQQIAQQLVTWEMNRRAGRARVLTVTADSWRDSAGNLWQPNTLVPVNFPALNVASTNLLISQVTFSRVIDSGTTAILTLMPPEAFAPQPIILDPIYADTSQAIARAHQ